MQARFWVATLAIGTVLSTSAADIYRWVDRHGVTHYGAQPPSTKQSYETLERPDNLQVVETEFPDPDFDAPDQAQEAANRKAKAQVAAQEESRRQYCSAIRQNLAQLQVNPRLRVKEADGSYRKVTEEERQQRMQDLQAKLDKTCQD